MALEFPPHFPSAFVAPVIAARIRAEREFRDELVRGGMDHGKTAALKYLVILVAAFGQQACGAVRAGAIQVQSVESSVDEFERLASVHAYYELPLSRWWPSWEAFRDELKPHLRWSQEWQALFADLERAAESAASDAPASALRPSKSKGQRLTDARTRRRAAVEPILKAKGLSPAGWATQAEVDTSVVYDYLDGKTRPRQATRNGLAKALGIAESKLPD